MSLRQAAAASRSTAPGLGAIGIFWGSFAAMVPAYKLRADVSDAQMGTALICTAVGGMAAMAYAGRIIKELGLDSGFTFVFTGTVQEEDCDGLAYFSAQNLPQFVADPSQIFIVTVVLDPFTFAKDRLLYSAHVICVFRHEGFWRVISNDTLYRDRFDTFAQAMPSAKLNALFRKLQRRRCACWIQMACWTAWRWATSAAPRWKWAASA